MSIVNLDSRRPHGAGVVLCGNVKCKHWWGGVWPVDKDGNPPKSLQCPECLEMKSAPGFLVDESMARSIVDDQLWQAAHHAVQEERARADRLEAENEKLRAELTELREKHEEVMW